MHKVVIGIIFLMILSGCDFEIPALSEADHRFGKQHFVSAVSIIELHKLRNGRYPTSLQELEFLGDWDAIWLAAVRYEKVDEGYHLFLERGWMNKPSLEFPIKFKQGLGILKTNIKWSQSDKT